MKHVRIDLAQIMDRDSFHDVFSRALDFPDYYGRNLDAFCDCMGSLEEPVTLELLNARAFEARLPELYKALIEIIDDVNLLRRDQNEAASITLVFLEDSGGKGSAVSDEPVGAKSHHEEQGLEALYRDVIFEHYRRPANKGVLEGAQIVTKGNNPVCGDRVTIYGKVKDGKLTEVSFEGKACAICMASTSMMTQLCTGKSLNDAGKHCDDFKAMIRNEIPFVPPAELPDLEALEGVRKFSARVKCATLGWTTLKNGIMEFQAGNGQSSIDDSCAT